MTFQDPSALPYRPGVGMVLLNQGGDVWIGQRLHPASAWQMPQGGIDEGETPAEAAVRELREEIGTDNVKILAESKDWYYYDVPPHLVGRLWGGAYRGQKQKWFALRFLGDDSEIDLHTHHQEFIDWKWVSPQDLAHMVVSFKRSTYEQVMKEFDFLFN